MNEENLPFPTADSQDRLECKDLWGGICNRDIEISAAKVIGSIYSAPCCEGVRVETSTILASADVLDANAAAPLSGLKSAVLEALHQHTKQELTHDDVTLIALEIC